MSRLLLASWLALGVAVVLGTLADVPPPRQVQTLDGYQVLQADFHVHPWPGSAATLAPWDLVWSARYQGLDVIAVSGHNETWSGRAARWTSRHMGGALAIAGEEVHGPRFHMIAVGIERPVSWRLPALEAIRQIHAQGGVAIAAHPVASAWPAFDAASRRELDGTEVMQPIAFTPPYGDELRQFYRATGAAAIGSSDYHGLGPLGLSRTFVFAKEATEAGVLEALRAHRTVVFDDRGRAYGDPQCIRLAQEGGLHASAAPDGWAAAASRVLALVALLGLVLTQGRTRG
ncbi:MAG TPA: PHP-associated domain-containing protein [Thermoanaerobaculia bacterium]